MFPNFPDFEFIFKGKSTNKWTRYGTFLKASRKTLERRQWRIEVSLPLTVNIFHTLWQCSGLIYHFEYLLFHGAVYFGRVQFVPENSKTAKWKHTLGISHLARLCGICACAYLWVRLFWLFWKLRKIFRKLRKNTRVCFLNN